VTPIEAIDAEIAREQKELDELDELEKEADRIEKRMEEARAAGDPDWKRFLNDLIPILRRLARGDTIRKEIEGKRTARNVAALHPDAPLTAIDGAILAEDERVADLAGRAQRKRFEAWKADREGRRDEARKAREEAKALDRELDEELAHVRGKRAARRAAAKTVPRPAKPKPGQPETAYASRGARQRPTITARRRRRRKVT